MNKEKIYYPKEIVEIMNTEEMLVFELKFNKDNSITVLAQLGVYLSNGERYFAYKKIKLPKEKIK